MLFCVVITKALLVKYHLYCQLNRISGDKTQADLAPKLPVKR